MIRLTRFFQAAVIAAVSAAAGAETLSAPLPGPPGTPPVVVKTGFYLLNLASVNERTESFEADLYIHFAWKDPRLAFTPRRVDEKRRVLGEEGAREFLKGIWWPQVEFVNAVNPQVRNCSLAVDPDGGVVYQLGLASHFRSRYDFRRFPFDRQILEVRLQSFLYDDSRVRFAADPALRGYSGGDTCDDLRVEGVRTVCRPAKIPGIAGTYSEFAALISVSRNSAFYIWRVFFPTILIMAMSFTIYFIKVQELKDRASITLSCMLACIATQFAISFNMPKISCLTLVDKVYLVTYACLAAGAGVSVVEHYMHHRNHPRLNRCNRLARWLIPLLYAALIVWILLPFPR